jgi:predicted N-acetyltransferase YhbS
MNLTIRQEKETDYPSVHEVNKLAFGQDTEANLVDALRKNQEVFIPELSIVAIIDDEVVGHILFTRIWIIDDNHEEFESLALAPMAVIPTFQKKGIGGRLIKSGLERAKELNFRSVIVVGHEQYYPKFGFVPADKWNIRAPFDVPANAFMGLELPPGGLKGISGTVRYSREFEMA